LKIAQGVSEAGKAPTTIAQNALYLPLQAL